MDDLLNGSDDDSTLTKQTDISSACTAEDRHLSSLSSSSNEPSIPSSLKPESSLPLQAQKRCVGRRPSRDEAPGQGGCGKKNSICPLCGDLFTEKELGRHKRENHDFKCAFCPRRFTYVNGRDNHQNSAHTLAAVASQHKLSCASCGMGFSRSAVYEKHAKREHKVPCRERGCPRRFTNTTLMENHAEESHNTSVGGALAKVTASADSLPSKVNSMNLTTSPPVRVRNIYSGATILDSPVKKKSGSGSAMATQPSGMEEIQLTTDRLSALFGIKVTVCLEYYCAGRYWYHWSEWYRSVFGYRNSYQALLLKV